MAYLSSPLSRMLSVHIAHKISFCWAHWLIPTNLLALSIYFTLSSRAPLSVVKTHNHPSGSFLPLFVYFPTTPGPLWLLDKVTLPMMNTLVSLGIPWKIPLLKISRNELALLVKPICMRAWHDKIGQYIYTNIWQHDSYKKSKKNNVLLCVLFLGNSAAWFGSI